MKKALFAVILTAFLIIIPGGVLAHSDIHTFNHVDGKNILMVYYSLEQFQAKLPQSFAIKFYQIVDGRPIDYEIASVKFVKNGKTVEGKILKYTPDEMMSFSYDFPEPGRYDMEVELQKTGQNLTAASFPIVVNGGMSQVNSSDLVQNLVFVALGVLIAESGRYLFAKFRHKKE